MVPTGSICERSWRTRWLACLVLLAAPSAHADWRTVSMPGKPNDVVEVWAPGTFSVGYPQGAHLFLDGGLARTINGGTSDFESVGTYYDQASGCFVSVNNDQQGSVSSKGPGGTWCAGSSQVGPTPTSIVRVKHAVGGGAASLGKTELGDYGVGFSAMNLLAANTFTDPLGVNATLNGTFAVERVGDTLYAFAGTVSTHARFYWFDNLGNSFPSAAGDSSWGSVQTVELFSTGGTGTPAPYVVVGTTRGFLQGSLVGAGVDNLRMVQQLEPGAFVKSVDLNVQAGSSNGYGFGMALVGLPDGGYAVASPVPMQNDRQAGTRWLFRSLPSGFPRVPLKQVACTGASYCVITADQLNTNNLVIYTNDAGPQLSVQHTDGGTVLPADAGVVLSEDQVLELTLGGSDPEGDPVLVTMTPSSTTTPRWSLTQADAGLPGEPLVVRLASGTFCQDQQVGSFTVHASDGLAAHDSHRELPVLVRHTRPPTVPPVALSAPLVAGGQGVGLSVSDTTKEGCKLVGYQWRVAPGGPTGLPGPSLVQQDGGTAVLEPPSTLCAANGGDFPFELRVTDEGGLSNMSLFNVHVAPWGKPNAAFGAGAVANMTAGEALVFKPTEPLHVCEGSSGFPGVETTWTALEVDGGLPEGLTLRTADTREPVSTFPVRAPGLLVETQDCLESDFVLSAVNRTGTPDGGVSATSSLPVRVRTVLGPLDAGVLELGHQPLSADELRVTVGARNLNCPERRPGLRAALRLDSVSGGGTGREVAVPLPSGEGEWRVSLGVGCEGGRFRVTGALVDDGGGRSAASTLEIETPRLSAALEALPEEAALVASCEGARATLTQTFPVGACQESAVTWTQVSGPELDQGSLSGDTVSLATRETRLESLVGQSVVMRVTATASPGNEASIEHTLPVTVEPFVRLHRRAEVPVASDTELVGVSVALTNTLSCGVEGVDYVERMAGMTYVAGSARFNGVPVEATWADGALSVRGLSLEAGAPGRLTYVARPHLMGERRMEGEALLNDVLISQGGKPGVQVPDSGCGCASSGPGPVLFALGALVAAVRRRRR
jgi:MYXO-CTERM domain-containing protein